MQEQFSFALVVLLMRAIKGVAIRVDMGKNVGTCLACY